MLSIQKNGTSEGGLQSDQQDGNRPGETPKMDSPQGMILIGGPLR
ncbi:hypothetical protein GCM10020331_005400 [Ectobacillus funiculus]